MKRRQFLGMTAAGLAVAAWPGWLREAFADGDSCPAKGAGAEGSEEASRVALVAAAFRRAQKAKRPLLVLVIPADDSLKWDRGEAFGELLNHGADKDLAPLASVEVVCATTADLARVVPAAGAGDPLMILVATDSVPATVKRLDAPLPQHGEGGGNWDYTQRDDDQVSDARIALLARLLRDAIGSGGNAATVLAAQVRKRLKDRAPEGAHWGNSSGCGTTIEGVRETSMVACGMGHSPAKSRRFLYFFSIKNPVL